MYKGLIHIKNPHTLITNDKQEFGLKPGEWYGVDSVTNHMYTLTYIPINTIMDKRVGNLLTWHALQTEYIRQYNNTTNLQRRIHRSQLQTAWVNDTIETVNVTNISEVLCTPATS